MPRGTVIKVVTDFIASLSDVSSLYIQNNKYFNVALVIQQTKSYHIYYC